MKTQGTRETRARLAAWRCRGVGGGVLARLVARFGGVAESFEAKAVDRRAAGVSEAVAQALERPDWDGADADLRWLEADGHHLVHFDDADFPPMLADIHGPPGLLFVNGERGCIGRMQVAVVGSRHPTAGGRETAESFARHLARTGLVVTSGLAAGIDAAAHRGALAGAEERACAEADTAPGEAVRGVTVAVTGHGPDRIYPASNRALAERIVDAGAIVTEFPTGVGPRPEHFPRRNRIIAGLSLGTLVVEAATRSGSLITARMAMESGREVFAIPGSIHNPLARGCHALIRDGAKLVETADDILEELGALLLEARISGPDKPHTDDAGPVEGAPDGEYQRLLDAMGYDPVSVDTVVERSGLTANEVSSMLLLLELQGHVEAHPGARYARVTDAGTPPTA
ncbi:MAG: DNA-processing protein DprA [Gammaproteobacteria bacterium]